MGSSGLQKSQQIKVGDIVVLREDGYCMMSMETCNSLGALQRKGQDDLICKGSGLE